MSYHLECVGLLLRDGECALTSSAYAGKPHPPDGGCTIRPPGCRRAPGPSKSNPRAFGTRTGNA
eukprot:8915481-Pyramimonas_sp.AAC.1